MREKKHTKNAIAHFEEWVIHKIHNVNLFLVKQKTISLLFKAEQKSSCQSKNVSNYICAAMGQFRGRFCRLFLHIPPTNRFFFAYFTANM